MPEPEPEPDPDPEPEPEPEPEVELGDAEGLEAGVLTGVLGAVEEPPVPDPLSGALAGAAFAGAGLAGAGLAGAGLAADLVLGSHLPPAHRAVQSRSVKVPGAYNEGSSQFVRLR